jgi:HK97 family phage major capsid protein
MPTSVELRQRRASLWEEAKSLHALAEKEKRQLNAEEREQWDRINSEIDSLKVTIERMERIDQIDAEMVDVPEPTQKPATFGFLRSIEQANEGIKFDLPDSPLPNDDQYRTAFGAYLRQGLGGMKPELRAVIQPYYGAVDTRALATTSAGAGGATVPEEFYRQLVEAMEAFGGMRQARTTKIRTSSGATMPIPLVDDTHNTGAILAEGTELTGTEDPAFGTKDLGAYMYTSKIVRISIQLLQDSAFPLEGWLAGALGRRLGRATNGHFTTGTGSGQPEGILTGAGEGVTDASLTMDYTDLVDLEHSVDPAYRSAGAEWMFHDTSLSKLKQMEDSDGRPIWLPGVAVREADRILGYPYVINQSMPQAAAGAKAILFGDFSYYFIRDVLDLRVLRLEEKFAEYLQVGFLAFLRTDGVFATPSDVEDTENVPVKYLQFAGSSSP